MKRIVIDTNVLVSGLLRPGGSPGRIVDLMLAGEYHPVFDDRIFLEYRQVLSRPRFGFRNEDAHDLLLYMQHSGTGLTVLPLAVNLPDPKDQPFLEVAAASQSPIVIGNLRHFPKELLKAHGVMAFTPQEFLRLSF